MAVAAACALLSALLVAQEVPAAGHRPNILWIMAEDISTELASAQEAVRRLQEDYVQTINLAVIILCLTLVWTIVSQIIVIRWAWNVTNEADAA